MRRSATTLVPSQASETVETQSAAARKRHDDEHQHRQHVEQALVLGDEQLVANSLQQERQHARRGRGGGHRGRGDEQDAPVRQDALAQEPPHHRPGGRIVDREAVGGPRPPCRWLGFSLLHCPVVIGRHRASGSGAGRCASCSVPSSRPSVHAGSPAATRSRATSASIARSAGAVAHWPPRARRGAGSRGCSADFPFQIGRAGRPLRAPKDRSRKVPVVRARAREGAVEAPVRHAGEAIGERRHVRLDGGSVLSQRRVFSHRASARPCARRRARPAATRRAAPSRPSAPSHRSRGEELLARRRIERRRHRPPGAHDCEAHAPAVVARDEAARAVDRVDDEDRLARQPRRVVGRLLREPAIGRAARQGAWCAGRRRPPCRLPSRASRPPSTRRSGCAGRRSSASAPPSSAASFSRSRSDAPLTLRFPSFTNSAFNYPVFSYANS